MYTISVWVRQVILTLKTIADRSLKMNTCRGFQKTFNKLDLNDDHSLRTILDWRDRITIIQLQNDQESVINVENQAVSASLDQNHKIFYYSILCYIYRWSYLRNKI